MISMKPVPEDLRGLLDGEPRLVEADQANRSLEGRREVWWVALVDTVNCYDPEEIALALREKGLPTAEGSKDAVWLRPLASGEEPA